MAPEKVELSLEERMMVLDLWAHGVDIRQKFTEDKIKVVPGLKEILDVTSALPGAVGWGDDPVDTT